LAAFVGHFLGLRVGALVPQHITFGPVLIDVNAWLYHHASPLHGFLQQRAQEKLLADEVYSCNSAILFAITITVALATPFLMGGSSGRGGLGCR